MEYGNLKVIDLFSTRTRVYILARTRNKIKMTNIAESREVTQKHTGDDASFR